MIDVNLNRTQIESATISLTGHWKRGKRHGIKRKKLPDERISIISKWAAKNSNFRKLNC